MNCPHCQKPTDATAYRIAKGDRVCRACRNANAKAWRARRKAEGRPVVASKTWAPEKRAKWYADHADELREKSAARMRDYQKDPKLRAKHEARWKVRRELAAGRLKKSPCSRCGWPKVEAHHPDYSKPLEVIWLCPSHHRAEHAKARGTK